MLLLILFAGTISKARDSRLECSWLDDSTGLDWSGLPFVDVAVMTLELVLASKAVVAAVLAPEHGAGELLLIRTGAVLLVVAFELREFFRDGLTILLEASIFTVLTVVALLMLAGHPPL